MRVNTRGGIFGSTQLFGGGLFDGTVSGGFGAYEQSTTGVGQRWSEEAGERWLGGVGWSREAGEKWMGGIGQARQIDCVNCSCDDPDCLVACPGCASELARVDCRTCSCSQPDCAVSCSTKCSPINCTTCDCGNPTCQTWCTKCKWKYPWMIFSQDTVELQKEINDCLIAKERCPLPKTDGKMGPLTCGAARFCGMDNVLATCREFKEPGLCPHAPPPPPPPPIMCEMGEELIDGECVPKGGAVKPPTKKGISAAWIVGGLLGAAAIATAYALSKKKEKAA